MAYQVEDEELAAMRTVGGLLRALEHHALLATPWLLLQSDCLGLLA
jgi:hypothetical protein